MKTVYLDNNATTQVAPEVLEAMLPYYSELYGNPSSMHSFGGQVAQQIREAREKVAALIGATPDEIIFTSCGTESDNAAIRSALATNPEKKHIVTSRVEHPAIRSLFANMAGQGYRVTELPVDKNGILDMEQLVASLTPDTAVVSLMWANNETGVIFPVEKAAELVHERGILFHSDAVQSTGKIPIDMKKNSIDMLSISGHKLHAPKGIGVLYIRRGTKFSPFMIGGHQEKGRRGGTENTPSIIGLGKASELAAGHLVTEDTTVRRLRDRLEAALLNRIPQSRVNGDLLQRLPNTTNISFEFVEGEGILLLMNEYGICASSGSACTSGSLQPSHVLRAMGVPFTMAHGSIRFSLSIYNTEEEIDFVIEKLPPIIERLRSMSPYWTSVAQACVVSA
jgi:cysteine desulfurase